MKEFILNIVLIVCMF